MQSLKIRVIANYVPLLHKFAADLIDYSSDELEKIPMPFLPIYGDLYENTTLRTAIIGMETKGWGNTKVFLDSVFRNPEGMAFSERESFRNLDFTKWGNNFGNSFWDVAMYFLAQIHGIKNWKSLKHKENMHILSSFLWGNVNSLERFEVTAGKSKNRANRKIYEAVKKASLRFDSGPLLLKTYEPQVIFLTTKNITPQQYFTNKTKLVKYRGFPESDMNVYRIPEYEAYVFHMPHPTQMRFTKNLRKEYYCDKILMVLDEVGLLPKDMCGLNLTGLIKQNVRGHMDKYEFINWVAHELQCRNRAMTARELSYLLNDCGFCTNRGTEFTGNARGPYKLLRAAYHRAMNTRDEKTAERIANAFIDIHGKPAWMN